MSLDGLLQEKLARWRPDGRQTLEVSAPELAWSADVTADAADLVGCRLWELSLRRNNPSVQAEELKARAHGICGRVTGLLETLSVVEIDDARGVALLRSGTPSRRGDVPAYYELLLHADGACVARRYEGPHGEQTKRQQVAFGLTYETLGKLVADLTL